MGTWLVFIRHGEAAGGSFAAADADRPLTEHGKEQAQTVAAVLTRAGIVLSRLFASPLQRAQETAAALKEAGLAEVVEKCEELLPERGLAPLLKLVGGLGEGTFAFVGHEPLLSATVETLCFGAPLGRLALVKGSVCLLSKGEGGWQLVALLPPQWLLAGAFPVP